MLTQCGYCPHQTNEPALDWWAVYPPESGDREPAYYCSEIHVWLHGELKLMGRYADESARISGEANERLASGENAA